MSAREGGWEYGPLWKRFLAFVIDCIVLRIAQFVVSLPFTPFLIFASLEVIKSDAELSAVIPLLLLEIGLVVTIAAVFLLYFTLAESSRYQTTVGKYVFDLKVTDTAGRRISLRRALARTLGKLLTAASFGIGFVTARLSQKRQTLHDKIASTYVVKAAATLSPEKPAPKVLLDEKALKIAFAGAIVFLSVALFTSAAALVAGYVFLSEGRLNLFPNSEKTGKEMPGGAKGDERHSLEEIAVYVDHDTPPSLLESSEPSGKMPPWKREERVFPLRIGEIRPTLVDCRRGRTHPHELVLFAYINVDGSPVDVIFYSSSQTLRPYVATAIKSTYVSKFEPAKKDNVPLAAWWSVVWRPINAKH